MPASTRPLLLALLGSPCQEGANSRLLSAFIQEAGDWEIVRRSLPELKILPCLGCQTCKQNQPCVQPDRMPKLFRLFERAQALVLAAPVYFYGFPAQTKAVIDRCLPLWYLESQRRAPVRLKRPGYFISTCASQRHGEFGVIVREAKAFFHTIGFQYTQSLLVPGLDGKPGAHRLNLALQHARTLGRQLNHLL
ncbi:flavodoxin family protein [bacterium]|nr:flavodoxin family protein [bacterium]